MGYIYVEGNLLKELAHMIVEADKSQYLQSEQGSWRPRKPMVSSSLSLKA